MPVKGERKKDTKTPAHAHGEEVPARPRRPREETARLGKEIYERAMRRQVQAYYHREIVTVDVDSENWTVAEGEVTAVGRLRVIRPSAVNVLFERVGYRALRSFGAGSPRRTG